VLSFAPMFKPSLNRNEPPQSVAVVTVEQFQKLDEKINKILEAINSGSTNPLSKVHDEYIKKEDAMELLGKKTTWMWEKEREGLLKPYKIGRKTLYKLNDLRELIENSKND